MITTRGIFVKLGMGRKQFSRVTTKDVDASIRVEPPKRGANKRPIVSTNKLADVSDISGKARRDKIMAEREVLDIKDAKKEAEKKKKEEQGPKLVEPSEELKAELKEAESKLAMTESMEVVRKHWKDMTDEEKKDAYKERAKKAKATREAKKKEEK